MGNTIKDWDVRLQEIEGRMHENTTLVQRVNTSFRSLESSMQTLITQARQINMQSQDLSIQVKQDITDQQLKMDDRIRHLEIIPSKIVYIENLIEDEFKKYDNKINDIEYTNTVNQRAAKDMLDNQQVLLEGNIK